MKSRKLLVISARVTKNEEVGSHAERALRMFKIGYSSRSLDMFNELSCEVRNLRMQVVLFGALSFRKQDLKNIDVN